MVQLDWAIDFAGRYLDLPLRSGRQFQVKFNAAILPEDRLTLTLVHLPDKNRLRFEYAREGRTCSSGQLAVTA